MATVTNPTTTQLATYALEIADSVISRDGTQREKSSINDLAVAVAVLAQAVLGVTPTSFTPDPGINTTVTTKAYAVRTK